MSDHHIAIIGSGFSGMGMAIRLLGEGKTDFVVLERADDVGGTWQANRYPGCQCDIPSHLYSFSFAPNPNWTRTYSKQQEIWDYMRGVAEDYGVMPYIRLNHEVTGADWDEDEQHWRIQTSQGEITADVLVAGPGGLSEPSIPSIPGLEQLRGPRVPHGRVARRPRPDRRAGGGDRHRRLVGPGGAQHPAPGRAAQGLHAHSAVDRPAQRPPHHLAGAAAVPARARRPEARALDGLLDARADGVRPGAEARRGSSCSRRRPGATWSRRCPTPSCAAA